jgi:hypothetical protein
LGTLTPRVKVGAHFATRAYRYANGVPLAEGADALKANWCEVTVTDHQGKVTYRNGWIPNCKITDQKAAALVAAGRARWKIENEHNNTLNCPARAVPRPPHRPAQPQLAGCLP